MILNLYGHILSLSPLILSVPSALNEHSELPDREKRYSLSASTISKLVQPLADPGVSQPQSNPD
jgi:hypothetical protein